MCRIRRKDYHPCIECRDELSVKLRANSDMSLLRDELIQEYEINILKIVLASTVLFAPDLYSAYTQNWAYKYTEEIGFLKGNFRVPFAPVTKVSQLILLLFN